MADYATLLRDHLTLTCRSIDRIFLRADVPRLQTVGWVRQFLRWQRVDFLGFHNRLVRGRTPRSAHLVFLTRWPARKAVVHAREWIRCITARARLWIPVEVIVTELNLFLRGWAGYFRYGNSALLLGQIRNYALRHPRCGCPNEASGRRASGWGMTQVLLSPDHLGLIRLDGIVVPPKPFRDWRVERRR